MGSSMEICGILMQSAQTGNRGGWIAHKSQPAMRSRAACIKIQCTEHPHAMGRPGERGLEFRVYPAHIPQTAIGMRKLLPSRPLVLVRKGSTRFCKMAAGEARGQLGGAHGRANAKNTPGRKSAKRNCSNHNRAAPGREAAPQRRTKADRRLIKRAACVLRSAYARVTSECKTSKH